MESIKMTEYTENAIRWAKERLGDTTYRGKCLAFVEDAYEQSNRIEMFGGDTAKESADQYRAISRKTEPPPGAFVFFDWTGKIGQVEKNYGHVGIAIGNGEIIHAWDKVRIDDLAEMEDLSVPPGSTRLRYLGWAPPEVFLEGFRSADLP